MFGNTTPITKAGVLLAVAASTIAAAGGVAQADTSPSGADTPPRVLWFDLQNDFGHVLMGRPESHTLHIVNGTGMPILPPTIGVTNASGFSVGDAVCSSGKGAVPADGTCDVPVTFAPTAPGLVSGRLDVRAVTPTDPPVTVTAQVFITGWGDAFRVDAGQDFGSQALGTLGAPQALQVHVGGRGMQLRVRIVGEDRSDFLIAGDDVSGDTLSAGPAGTRDYPVLVRFAPGALGARSAALEVTSTTGERHVQQLSGVGTPLPPGEKGDKGDKGDPAFKLVIAPASTRLSSRAGRRVALSYAATMRAKLTLTVTKGKRRIATVRANVRTGRNTIAWNGRRGRRAAAPGLYRLRLRAVSANGQAATTAVALRIVKRAR